MQKEENLYTPGKIRLQKSGKYFDPFNPVIDDIHIEDIAHSLSLQCRFAGHTTEHYSVAEHCINVCRRMPLGLNLTGLLHDASEAYLIDLPSPIKAVLPEYKSAEERLLQMIAERFGLQYPFCDELKAADKAELEWEWENVVLKRNSVPPMAPQRAYFSFMTTFIAYL
jgi:hypothetical protein